MPEGVQKLFQEATLETQAWEREALNAEEAKYLAEMESGGMTVTRLTPEQTQAFQTAMQAVWDEFRSKLGNELIASVVETR